MIVGIGVDTVEIARFRRALDRAPALGDRLFAPVERAQPVQSLAARFAAKEALVKALGGDHGLSWHDMVVPPSRNARPEVQRGGALEAVLALVGASGIHLSLTHDGGIATAFVVLEREQS